MVKRIKIKKQMVVVVSLLLLCLLLLLLLLLLCLLPSSLFLPTLSATSFPSSLSLSRSLPRVLKALRTSLLLLLLLLLSDSSFRVSYKIWERGPKMGPLSSL